jgi:hypothetical protein
LREERFQFQGAVVAVASADEGVAAAVGYRLRDRRLKPTTDEDVRLDFLLRPNGRDQTLEAHVKRRPVYDTPSGQIYYRPSDDMLEATLGAVRLEGHVGEGRATMSAERYAPEDRYLAAHPLTMIVLCESMKRRGRYNLHAGCVANGARGAVIAGPSGSGKSTLVLALADRGLDYLSDDMIFLTDDRGRITAHGFSDAIGLTCATAARFTQLSDLSTCPPPAGFRKHLIRIEERFQVRTVESCAPAFVIFPELALHEKSRLEPLDPEEAWLRLVPDVLLTHPAATEAHLDVIAALTAQGACYRLRSGPDVRRSAELIEELLDDPPTR